jgi:hypothetical protein
MELLTNSVVIGGEDFVLFSTNEYSLAEIRCNEFASNGKAIVCASYGYYAGPDADVALIVKHVQGMLLKVFLHYEREGRCDEMRIQMQPYRLNGSERSSICEEFEDIPFICDESWSTKKEKRIEAAISYRMGSAASPFRINNELNPDLAEYYFRFFPRTGMQSPLLQRSRQSNTNSSDAHRVVSTTRESNSSDAHRVVSTTRESNSSDAHRDPIVRHSVKRPHCVSPVHERVVRHRSFFEPARKFMG